MSGDNKSGCGCLILLALLVGLISWKTALILVLILLIMG